MEIHSYKTPIDNRENQLDSCFPIFVGDDLVGVRTSLIPTTFQEVKDVLELHAHNQQGGQMLLGVQARQEFLRIVERVFEIAPIDSTPITTDRDEFLLFHDTDNQEAVTLALENDKLLQPPRDKTTWATRCYGLGLACNTRAEQTVPDDKSRLIIRVPYQQVSLVEKRALWSSYQKSALKHIAADRQFHDEFNRLLKLSAHGEARDEVELLWERLKAFNYRACFLDAFCLLHPEVSKKQVSELIQSKYYFENGDKADHFGYRTYTESRFLIPGEIERAVAWASNELGVIQVEDEGEKFSELGSQIQEVGLTNTDIHTGWAGVIDPESSSYQEFLIFQLSLQRPALREKLSIDKGSLSDVLNGFFPIGEIDIPGNLVFGTDLGGNNLAVLKHFDKDTMSCEFL
ncbi:hypothetical protein KC573_04245 [candidate division WWE3 bacterium]|nr:hypothetical protein [candidate division WWE3 bacterium]